MTKINELLDCLRRYSPCDVADALVSLGNAGGGYIPHLQQQSALGATAVGVAYTVEYAPIGDRREAIKEGYIDHAPKGSFLVIGTSPGCQMISAPYTSITNALYGGLMSTRAKYLNCAGTLVMGKIRDIDQHRKLDYPVWSYGVGITAPGSVVKLVAVDKPLAIGTETVEPGDIVVADENGVAIIPEKLLEKVVEYIPKRVAADLLVEEDIGNGLPANASQKKRRGEAGV